TVRILGRDRDVALDLAGGCRVPKLGERQARTVADLRAAGVGVDRVLLVHDGTPAGSDLFRAVLTMLDPLVALDVAAVPPESAAGGRPVRPGHRRLAGRAPRRAVGRLDDPRRPPRALPGVPRRAAGGAQGGGGVRSADVRRCY